MLEAASIKKNVSQAASNVMELLKVATAEEVFLVEENLLL